jgi:hypothetical protein
VQLALTSIAKIGVDVDQARSLACLSTWLAIVDSSSKEDQMLYIRNAAAMSILESGLLFHDHEHAISYDGFLVLVRFKLWLIATRLLNDDDEDIRNLLYQQISSICKQSMTAVYCWQHHVIPRLADSIRHAISNHEADVIESLDQCLRSAVSQSSVRSELSDKVFDREPLNQFMEAAQMAKALISATVIAMESPRLQETSPMKASRCNIGAQFLDIASMLVTLIGDARSDHEILLFQCCFRQIFVAKLLIQAVRSILSGASSMDMEHVDAVAEGNDRDVVDKFMRESTSISARLEETVKIKFPSIRLLIEELCRQALTST